MSDWIPVSERLPEKNEYIKNNGLFNVSDGNRSYSEWFDIYDTQRFGEPTMTGFRVDYAVIAWMPLPEPYQSEIPTGAEGDKRIADKPYCTECLYFKYTNEDSDYWYGTKCEKDNHEAQPSMYAIQSLHNRCPLTEGSDKE